MASETPLDAITKKKRRVLELPRLAIHPVKAMHIPSQKLERTNESILKICTALILCTLHNNVGSNDDEKLRGETVSAGLGGGI